MRRALAALLFAVVLSGCVVRCECVCPVEEEEWSEDEDFRHVFELFVNDFAALAWE